MQRTPSYYYNRLDVLPAYVLPDQIPVITCACTPGMKQVNVNATVRFLLVCNTLLVDNYIIYSYFQLKLTRYASTFYVLRIEISVGYDKK